MPACCALPLVASTPVKSMIEPISIGDPAALPVPPDAAALPVPAAGAELAPAAPLLLLELLLQAAAASTIAAAAETVTALTASRARARAGPAGLLLGPVISVAFR
jgi:hypothetical protein